MVMVICLGLDRSLPRYLCGSSGPVRRERRRASNAGREERTFSRATPFRRLTAITVWYYSATSGVGYGMLGSGPVGSAPSCPIRGPGLAFLRPFVLPQSLLSARHTPLPTIIACASGILPFPAPLPTYLIRSAALFLTPRPVSLRSVCSPAALPLHLLFGLSQVKVAD